MTSDDLQSKTMRSQPDQESHEEKAKGLYFHSPGRWYAATVTLGILGLGLLVTILILVVQLYQVSDLLKQQQANLTCQENMSEGQFLAQQGTEKSSKESQTELKEMIETLSQMLDEKSKILTDLQQQNLNLQEALKKAANYSGPCPQDWIWHEKSCYFFSSGPFNWETSQENCLSLGAQLLKINSTEDLEFISQASAHSNFPFWMGLSRRAPSSSWLWEDGSPLLPHLFRLRGAVTQKYPSDTCAYIQRGTVFADNCILSAFSICQKRAILLQAQ
ncbi:oxidized low-density lipoprotein receptor 1 [Sorex araneus]|uniref:oxidized low-density lipoprotein receptor 1 n=1 Tax=Sorex araneus TaxID=42254 RepID=UPI002433B8DE|nr:oxidized low-density lipoprotein receptor 1 [Sorex araneus]